MATTEPVLILLPSSFCSFVELISVAFCTLPCFWSFREDRFAGFCWCFTSPRKKIPDFCRKVNYVFHCAGVLTVCTAVSLMVITCEEKCVRKIFMVQYWFCHLSVFQLLAKFGKRNFRMSACTGVPDFFDM